MAILFPALLAGCAQIEAVFPALGDGTDGDAAMAAAPRTTPRPPQRAEGPISTTGQQVEALDTTTAAERAQAAAAPASATGAVGRTVAGLGDPARPGFWIETSLVSRERPGRVVLSSTGASVQVKLIPVDGPAGGGSRLSLAAMRLLEAPLTELVEVEVFAGG